MAKAIYETEMSGVETPSDNTLAPATATTNTASTAPYSSEGPTLPILGGAGEHGAQTAAATAAERDSATGHTGQQAAGRPSKKRKSADVATTPTSKQKLVSKLQIPNPELEPLRTPWMLLPPELRDGVEKRLGGAWWGGNCVPVAMTRNQNIRSGVNKLKVYLGAGARNSSVDIAEDVVGVLRSEGLVVAVSAMGEATTKLVGILEVLRRVVGEGGDGGGEEGGEKKVWCMYTSLSSRMVDRRRSKRNGDGVEIVDGFASTKGTGVEIGKKGDEEDASFEPTANSKETEEKTPKERSVPVLTVWLSRTSIPEFEKEFGEEKFTVVKAGEEG